MKINKEHKQSIVSSLGVLIIVLVAGCRNELSKNEHITPAQVSTPTSKPTLTISASPSSTPPTATVLLTPPPTPTLIPTLPPDEAVAWFIAGLLDNGGCQLPCFLGDFEPGVTSQGTVEAFVAQYGEYLGEKSYARGRNREFSDNVSSLFITNHFENYYLAFWNYYKFRDGVLSLVDLYSNAQALGENHGAQLIGIEGYLEALNYYSVSHILQEYGQPTQVLVFTYDNSPWMKYDFLDISIVMHYQELGFLIEYGIKQIDQGETLKGCFEDLIDVNLYISDRSLKYKIIDYMSNDVGPSFSKGNISFYLPIEEAAGISLEEFYQMFKEPGQDKCIETPASLWP